MAWQRQRVLQHVLVDADLVLDLLGELRDLRDLVADLLAGLSDETNQFGVVEDLRPFGRTGKGRSGV